MSGREGREVVDARAPAQKVRDLAGGLGVVYSGKRGSKAELGRLWGAGGWGRGWALSSWRCLQKLRAEDASRQMYVQVGSTRGSSQLETIILYKPFFRRITWKSV